MSRLSRRPKVKKTNQHVTTSNVDEEQRDLTLQLTRSARMLLDLLNERLTSDLGPDAARYTMDHLHQEIGSGASGPVGTKDWGGLRRLMSQARRSGVLGRVSEQVIDDFAVVFQLNARQVMSLKDIVLAEQGE